MLLYEKSGNPAHNWGAEEKKVLSPSFASRSIIAIA
jgi:hypothetical protein